MTVQIPASKITRMAESRFAPINKRPDHENPLTGVSLNKANSYQLPWFAITLALLSSNVPNTPAGVQITRFDPPLSVSALADVPGPGPNILAVDFDYGGQVDFRLLYGCCGGIDCYFNDPTRIVIRRQFYPGLTNVYGSLGALPLGTIVGSNLVSSVSSNQYVWHPGNTNRFDDETRLYGDHSIIALAYFASDIPGEPLAGGGDPADKEGVFALEFLIGTNRHYGYIHFDFRKEIGWYKGCGGYILGWAYETEPDAPIVAEPIVVPPTPFRLGIQKQSDGVFDLDWRATPGATYCVQGASSGAGPFTNFTPEIIPPSGAAASPIQEVVTFYGMQDFPVYFWRVVRSR